MTRWLAALALLVASCAWRPSSYSGPREITGSCPGACRHYVRCKDSSEPALHDACVAECRVIFEEDGEPDVATLGMFEQLQCPDAIGFVEGTSGRGPGATPPELAPNEAAQPRAIPDEKSR